MIRVCQRSIKFPDKKLAGAADAPKNKSNKIKFIFDDVRFIIFDKFTNRRNLVAINITKIPRIMRANRMHTGAKLMTSWFSRPIATAPNYGTVDTTTITMKWALNFARAKKVYDEIVNGKIWVNDAAQRVIEKKLIKKGLVGSSPKNFGDLSKSAPVLDAEQINQRTVTLSDDSQNLDDMDASLGNFVFQVVIAGTVSPKGKVHQVDVKEVAIFIRDSYDFNGDQFLGTWNDTKDTVSRSMFGIGGDMVWNSDFRKWRKDNGMGGDYMIYSDVKKISLQKPDSFIIPVPPPPRRHEVYKSKL